MNFRNNLDLMRRTFRNTHIRGLELQRPAWLTSSDKLIQIYKDQEKLFKHGQVYYGCLVQANELLFSKESKAVCPALVTYSTDERIVDHLSVLKKINNEMFRYKDEKAEDIPDNYKAQARIITDEMSREKMDFYTYLSDPLNIVNDKKFKFSKDYSKTDPERINIRMCCVMGCKEHLPKSLFIGPIFPIIAVPEKCDSIMILPDIFWSEEFRDWYLYESKTELYR
ncbi:MAG: hypothetical protein K6G26_09535 [Lachnospiraceae bacterium]|nr:hypothetical protein [Lachnospiraceae bacterium]